VSDEKTILLYALSTLAQTCAALAAFVGAVGLYRLQSLHNRRRDLLRHIWESLGDLPAPEEDVLTEARRHMANRPALAAMVRDVEPIPKHLQQSRQWLMALEAWNLLVIGATLVGFNYVSGLASSAWTSGALWLTAVGTVAVTGLCVFVWTKD